MNLTLREKVKIAYQALEAIGLVNEWSVNELVASWLEWNIEQERIEWETTEAQWEAEYKADLAAGKEIDPETSKYFEKNNDGLGGDL